MKNAWRLKLAEFLLPDSFYVQHKWDMHLQKGRYPDFSQDSRLFHETVERSRGFVIRDANRWMMLNMLLDLAWRCKQGDYAELGTFRGNTARIIWKRKHASSMLYCFDTFEGFAEEDVAAEQDALHAGPRPGHFSDTSRELVREMIAGSRDGHEKLILKKGRFPDTFAGLEENAWRFVHLDCDLYAPTRAALEKFWHGLVPGGVLLLHDYHGGYEGVKRAVDEFFEPLGVTPVPVCDKSGSVVVIRGR